ncbi:hypothetical protein MCHI_001548 [Candidatus Magnetoovum chiemensis]|nr:hypothetical protein MCHI_001548 [Candidatus Magnetoovum chiemensis]
MITLYKSAYIKMPYIIIEEKIGNAELKVRIKFLTIEDLELYCLDKEYLSAQCS